MYSLVYVSAAVERFSTSQLEELLKSSREKNRRLGVTGMLLYKDGNFMQALEGEESDLRDLMTSIEKDSRHTGILRLIQGHLEHRQFPDWSMGFRDLNAPEGRHVEGYRPFLNTPFTGAEFAANPSKAQRLLLTFKEHA